MEHILVQIMSQLTSITEEESKAIQESFPIKTFSKGHMLLKEGMIAHDAYYVIEGCIREYELLDGEEDIDPAMKQLLRATCDCWIQSCQFVKRGNYYKDIGGIIEDYITPLGYTTVKNFCGSVFHTNSNILHYKNNEPNGEMSVGHTFTIEPMIC